MCHFSQLGEFRSQRDVNKHEHKTIMNRCLVQDAFSITVSHASHILLLTTNNI
jgi:hypothetical protein